jgi:parallel beta-helix repeat protein
VANKGVYLGLIFIVVFGLSIEGYAADPSSSTMQLTCPYWYGTFDAAGYSDGIYWGESPIHSYYFHEVLSGEWGAAIYYDGISTEPNAMWLTNQFIYPDWTTNSKFSIFSNPTAWHNQNNPTPGDNTGQSVIKNTQDNRIKVTIDYEIADLGASNRSPMTCLASDDKHSGYVGSDRYVLLQTYTITNISATAAVTNLELYQMLHAHPAESYANDVESLYSSLVFTDPLASYTPFNAVHTVGNFKYDITQWNTNDTGHKDFVGFSTTQAPDIIDTGLYVGNDGKPLRPGTHWDIEERNLNGVTYLKDEVAAAMGWHLGTLGVEQSVKRTVAFMFGAGTVTSNPVTFTKTSDVSTGHCVDPNNINNNLVTYSLCYNANGFSSTNVSIIDYLPAEMDFDPALNSSWTYNSGTHTATYSFSYTSTSSGCVQLKLKVNRFASPGSTITNNAEIKGDNFFVKASCNVNVCNWGGTIIYVDRDATAGFKNGTSWNNAFLELRDGITAAERLEGAITAIWVAAGTYKPVDSMITNYQNETFELPDNVALIGHFGGKGIYETSPYERDLTNTTRATILDGQIGTSSQAVSKVITATNVNNGLVDGFTIRGGYGCSGISTSGIYLDNSNVSIVNSRFENTDYGIWAANYSYPYIHPYIHNCTFFNNRSKAAYTNSSYCQPAFSYCTFDGNNVANYGIYAGSCATTVQNSIFKNFTSNAISMSDYSLSITDSIVKNNGGEGISASGCNVSMTHCLVEDNGNNGIDLSDSSSLMSERSIIRHNGCGFSLNDNVTTTIKNCWIHNNGDDGIYLAGYEETLIIRNNTIFGNGYYGIDAYYSDLDPDVRNCILNSNGGTNSTNDFIGSCAVNYCCLQYAHLGGTGNFVANPLFTFSGGDANDLHIMIDSPCRDAGDPYGIYTNEKDIDDEARSQGCVDIGADENSKADYNQDGIVNFSDFATFAASWLKTNAQVSLDNDTDVDFADLSLFCHDWLRQPLGWLQDILASGGSGSSMAMMMAGDDSITEDMSETSGDSLMITDVQTSRTLMPKRLARRVDVFYAITAADQQQSSTSSQLMAEGSSEQQMMLDGNTPMIYLVYDGNMTPDPNTEVTIYVHTDTSLLCMGAAITVTGDANITTGMSEADCNNYGWDNGWNSDPYIDPDGWIYLNGVSWPAIATETVSYFKFIYHSGEVSVSFITEDDWSCAFDANCQPVSFSTDALIFGRDPNE